MSNLFPTVGLVALIALAAYLISRLAARRRSRPTVPSAILPAHELQRQYGLYAENRPTVRLDPQRVPPQLQDLIPLAETWGIGDDIIRFDFEQKATEAARQELIARVGGRIEEVQEWLRSERDTCQLSEEAAAFMYLLYALDEVRFSGRM